MSFTAFRRRAVHAVRNYFHRDWTAEENLFNFDEVSPFIRRHLKRFYFSLMWVSISSAAGSCSYPTENIYRIIAVFSAFVSFLCFNLTAPWREIRRLEFLMLGAYCGWAAVTPWLSWLLGVDTGFVGTVIWANSVGVACFWASSMWTRSFEYVYFKAMLLCIPLLLLSVLVTSTVYGGDSDFWKFPICSWLLWCMAYLAAYSQEVVLKARRGDLDYVNHAVCLYTHLPPFLVRLINELCELKRQWSGHADR